MTFSAQQNPGYPPPRRFSFGDFKRLTRAEIIRPEESVKLIDGVIYTTHPLEYRRFSVAEYYRMVDAEVMREDDPSELINGVILEKGPITPKQAAFRSILSSILLRLLDHAAHVGHNTPVRLSPYTQPDPDLSVLRRRDDFYFSKHPGPDDALLVIEVSDVMLPFDREIKTRVYAAAGIAEMWIVNLVDDVVEVYSEPVEGVYQSVQQLRSGENLTLPGFDGLTVPIAALFKH